MEERCGGARCPSRYLLPSAARGAARLARRASLCRARRFGHEGKQFEELLSSPGETWDFFFVYKEQAPSDAELAGYAARPRPPPSTPLDPHTKLLACHRLAHGGQHATDAQPSPCRFTRPCAAGCVRRSPACSSPHTGATLGGHLAWNVCRNTYLAMRRCHVCYARRPAICQSTYLCNHI
jgi:hypothetical protein